MSWIYSKGTWWTLIVAGAFRHNKKQPPSHMHFKTLKYLLKYCTGYDDESWCFESHVDTIKCNQKMLAKIAVQGSSFDKEGYIKPVSVKLAVVSSLLFG